MFVNIDVLMFTFQRRGLSFVQVSLTLKELDCAQKPIVNLQYNKIPLLQ